MPKTSSTSCDQAIFVDQTTDACAFSYAALVEVDRLRQRFHSGSCAQGAVRPVQIEVSLVLAQDPPQMIQVPDEGTVQQPTAASPGLGAQELPPGRPGPVPGGIHAVDLENLPYG